MNPYLIPPYVATLVVTILFFRACYRVRTIEKQREGWRKQSALFEGLLGAARESRTKTLRELSHQKDKVRSMSIGARAGEAELDRLTSQLARYKKAAEPKPIDSFFSGMTELIERLKEEEAK